MLETQYLVNEKENKVVSTVKDIEGFPLIDRLEDLSYYEVMSGNVTSFYMRNVADEYAVNRLLEQYEDENLKLVTAKELFELTLKLDKINE